VTAVADELADAELMLPSRCSGWTVGDVLYHQLLDARRALRTFASPSGDRPDVDDIGYWRAYSPPSGDPGAPGGAEAAARARHVRIVASACPPGGWDDRTYALKGTGRLPVTATESAAIGALADRLPLFGYPNSHGTSVTIRGTDETGEHPVARWCLMGLVAFHFRATCACQASRTVWRTPGSR
jgi:Mycothiol maleylpyruvate isomerase N-terminal domain